MAINYDDPRFELPLNWIQENIDKGKSRKNVEYSNGESIKDLEYFLDFNRKFHDWNIEVEEWLELIDKEYIDREERLAFEEVQGTTVIVSPGEDNGLNAPRGNMSSWQKYRKILLENFDRETVNDIEKDSESVLRKISLNTSDSSAIKGMVVGSVQSGKTTNMASLMSMAADHGWNVFIVLSGMIDNLRVQTQRRLFGELSSTNGNVNWSLVENPTISRNNEIIPQNMDFNRNQYMIVTIKNLTRLRNLNKWLNSDKNKASQMKILVIDDEADQASVNTSDLDVQERKAINREIIKLVTGENGVTFGAVNYVGYTATPYANVLSESSDESLYPQDFIALLKQSPNYLGPSQIFGVEGEEMYPGLNIVNEIDQINVGEFNKISGIHQGKENDLPIVLKNAIGYFLASAASLRKHNFGRPVSMLVHTSIRQEHHDNFGNLIETWLKYNKDEVLKYAEKSWTDQHEKFSIDRFKESMPYYKANINNTRKPHKFNEIKEEILHILDTVAPITSSEKGEYTYHDGVHLNIDNSAYNRVVNDDEIYRLLYPIDKETRQTTPVFLVIGGATLSRGLTLEGLVSTYFVRNSGQADSLMQMGRWFGYRIGYELYPRIWMSSNAIDQFKYLADLDFSLRQEIRAHNVLGNTPKEVGIRIKTSPKASRLKITATNKSRGAIESDFDFTGASIQTTNFDNDADIMKSNLDLLTNFIDDLGQPKITNDRKMNSVYWEDVSFDKCKLFLKEFKFNDRFRMGNNIDTFVEWVESVTKEGLMKNWNIIAVGKGEVNHPLNDWHQKHFTWNKIERSKVKEEKVKDIRIQSLRSPADLYRDIDVNLIDDKDLVEKILKYHSSNYLEVRQKLGLEMTPQMMLYRINKDSKSNENSKTREDLNLEHDLVGIYISIPGGVKGNNYVTHMVIKLDKNIIDENDYDIEG